jgi:hypothetical protein
MEIFMKNLTTSRSNSCRITAVLLAVLFLTGCGGGTRVIKDSQAMQTSSALAENCDERICGYVDWVVVRNGPGSWAKNATWDEYLLRITNNGDGDVSIMDVAVVDSLGQPLSNLDNKNALKRGSSKTVKRYRNHDLKVEAGSGTGKLLAATGAAAVATIGVGVAIGGYTGLAVAAAAPVGIVILAPVLVLGSVMRGSKVNDGIAARRTPLPAAAAAHSEMSLDLFFPYAPSPQYVEVRYTSGAATHSLRMDTSAALDGLHIDNFDEN